MLTDPIADMLTRIRNGGAARLARVQMPESRMNKDASVGAILNVQLPGPHHLYWPDLDVDLAVESIEHPERFPLISKVTSNKPMEETR